MRKAVMAIATAMAISAFGQGQKITLTVENKLSPPSQKSNSPDRSRRSVVIVVRDNSKSRFTINKSAFEDSFTAALENDDFRVINPNDSLKDGEKNEESPIDLARHEKANGAVVVSINRLYSVPIRSDSSDNMVKYEVSMGFRIVDAWSKDTACSSSPNLPVMCSSTQYETNNGQDPKLQRHLDELLRTAGVKCANELLKNPKLKTWKPTPPPPPSLPPPTPDDPWLTLSDIDGVVQKHIDSMRADPVFRDNYDAAQKAIGRIPLVIVGGLVDLTKGKSPTTDLDNLLATASQNIRITLLRSRLVDAKDDSAVTAMTDRIIKNGNSPTEDGELMDALKQHGSPDFLMVGDIKYFFERKTHIYRIRLALHNLHTGKLVCEKIEDVTKNTGVSK